MGQRKRISLTLKYHRGNELIKQVEEYVSQLSTEEIKRDILEILLAKYLSLFKSTVTPELYQQELKKSLNFLGGLISPLEKELESRDLSPQFVLHEPLNSDLKKTHISEEQTEIPIQQFQRVKLDIG